MALTPYVGGSGGLVLKPVHVVTGENYTTWAIKVEADMDAAALWEAVVPPEDTVSAVIVKKDKPARAYLLRALVDDLLLHVAAKKMAAEIWSSLKARFIGADRIRAARMAMLRGDFERLQMDGSEMLDAFAGKISGMAARFAGLGSTQDDAVLVKKLLDVVRSPVRSGGRN
ncbi:retrotransposon protein [Hordeum vulgare]|nr:retrotransposon protein [Hordeum vulgare]